MAQANGLKKLRKRTGKKPEYECPNCRCKRYSPCTCMKKNGSVELPPIPKDEIK